MNCSYRRVHCWHLLLAYSHIDVHLSALTQTSIYIIVSHKYTELMFCVFFLTFVAIRQGQNHAFKVVGVQFLGLGYYYPSTDLLRTPRPILVASMLFVPDHNTRPSVQTVSDVYLKHIFSLDTSAFSASQVLDDEHAI